MIDYAGYRDMKVHLLLDGRGYDTINYDSDANVNLELICEIRGETDNTLDLENISILNSSPKGNFKRGRINKKYVIGVFCSSSKNKCEIVES